MEHIEWVDKERGCTCRRQSGGNLGTDMSAFADTSNDYLALTIVQLTPLRSSLFNFQSSINRSTSASSFSSSNILAASLSPLSGSGCTSKK